MIRPAILLAAIVHTSAAWAGVDTAQQAFERGDFGQAIAELQPLAEAGDAEALYWLGRSFDAIGEPGSAFGWLEKAAKLGHGDAQRLLGIYYIEGKIGAPDELAAACWYRESAMNGNAKAQRYLALMFADGIGVARNDEKAAYWLEAAAAQGNPDAENNLAHLYYFGVGLPKDPAKAAELYASAAERGVIAAKGALGRMYYWGNGVPQDLSKAMSLFREAAAANDVTAQYYLGRAYAEGQGVDRDLGEAYFWLTLAANKIRGVDEPDPDGWRAHEMLPKIAAGLSSDQIRSAIERADAWRAQ